MSEKNNQFTFENPEYRKTYWHTTSHILAQAMKRLHPEVKLAIGPAIENGFYYDFDTPQPFTEDQLAELEAEMRKICKEKLKLERFELPRAEALKLMEEKGEPYKVELINDLPEDAVISFYKQGDFTDLCAGPHLDSTGRVKGNAIKLTACNAAYWRGDSSRQTLQRIYGIAFPKKEELDEYLAKLEEARKRDHRRLGKELGLFTLMDEGPGFPFFLPKGMVLRNTLLDYWREVHKKYGYVEISTPIILNQALWHRSGHWDHYKDNMYTTVIDGEDYAVKPMNCPGGMLVYKTEPHSYRDLPLRMAELGLVHRHELSGALHGLFRVRCFTQDDAHIFMTWDQMESEIQNVVRLFDEVYSVFGLSYQIEVSTMPEDHIGEKETWDMATETLKKAISAMGKDFIINEGDGAFYGPKLDFHLADSLGRTWQCGTIQLDMQMPERFDLEYVGEDGGKHRPVMIHRVVLGSIERFIGVITEHFAGAFPAWLSPVQVKILPITDRTAEYADQVRDVLDKHGFRVEVDHRNEKIGKKIREAQLDKVPYMLVLGDKEAEGVTVAVRSRSGGDQGVMSLEEFVEILGEEVAQRLAR
ncbi:threonine--tRNA ligase [Pseudoflavonifractor sp. BIOML-A6]|nr:MULTISPECIES: threonine--tRNA ligase [unclassified Pseudoflavonifractor]MTQ96470.1 threonine--tRNA ligase [Pseudoflavonifractor sp. BIOML-A16]MTR05860.1 threonine--tRNA ligase [Pseudoflavonifractor sp. BIOML-A15]MTR31234.1 threonine--tRNA ligase [Pseudoflavonifractor sp. BIOML-A14]MTR72549.1 threonine--tRNA ligase [Pseudoflavonifractor sp. BIOML-A18]MTS63642.1 threonine--tRNA ligase [Pseudoflavonifractor sp. BIOML-A5]MTS72333.1 threonine--tRNA ligase [Pseudoflavonifractor sp. BIOML-A8]MTS